MESSTSKADIIIKPVLKAAVIPLALSVAGFICAKIMANRSVNLKGSSTETDDQVSYLKANPPKFRDEDVFHNFSSACMLSTECLEIQDNKHVLEEEISCLRLRLDELQKRESELEMQFIRYCNLKEQESVLMELSNMLLLEVARVEFLEREASSMEAESQGLEKLVGECLRALEQMEYWKSENGLLQRKVKKLLRKARRQYRVIREQDSKLEAREAEALGIHDAQETKAKVIKKLEYETGELRAVLERVQDEKKGLLARLALAEKSAASISKTEGEGVKIEDYIGLEKELENLKKDRAAEIKELIYLRWSNACLRHELMRNQAQLEQQAQEKDNNLEINLEGRAEIGNCEQCFGNMSSDQEHPKRKKLFRRLKRWVEGNEKGRGRLDEKERHGQVKCFGRHSVSDYAEEHQVARKSCSSASTHNIRL
ncbi:unnamed protein product [Malus baccata var. baccata]